MKNKKYSFSPLYSLSVRPQASSDVVAPTAARYQRSTSGGRIGGNASSSAAKRSPPGTSGIPVPFSGGGGLRHARSVDLYRAQLEEKDKTIEALKQAAKVRYFLPTKPKHDS